MPRTPRPSIRPTGIQSEASRQPGENREASALGRSVVHPKSITDKYAEAQAAEVEKQKAQNAQETAKVEAETRKIEAQGEADANKVLNDSLTDKVLMQHYIDALAGADSLTIVPDGSQPIITTGK